MKSIPKIALYIAIILFLSVSLDGRAETQAGLPKTETVLVKSQARVDIAPYDIIGRVRVRSLVHKELIVLNPGFELSR